MLPSASKSCSCGRSTMVLTAAIHGEHSIVSRAEYMNPGDGRNDLFDDLQQSRRIS